MKKSNSHYQTHRNRSMTNKIENIKLLNTSLNDNENQTKSDTFLYFYNNININSDIEMDESTLGDIEYAKTLQLALKDAINQNEKLTEELNKCIQENKELKEEIEEKDNVIYELSQYYHFCQTNHINNHINDHLNDTVDSSDIKVKYKNSSKNRRNIRSGKPKSRNKNFEKPDN